MEDELSDILIVGAGISGLALGWFLKSAGKRVCLLEQRSDPGGNIRSLLDDGYLMDLGPNSLLKRPGESLDRLINQLQLADKIVLANPQASKRYISFHGALEALPTSPRAFLRTPLFGMKDWIHLLKEPWIKPAAEEETVSQFVRRRLGNGFLDWAVDPFISGVYSGDPNRLSVRAATARIYVLEKEYGSLIRGALVRKWQGRSSGPTPQGELIGFHQGMQALPEAISQELGPALKLETCVQAIEYEDSYWVAQTDKGVFRAKHIVLATPAYVTAMLMESLNPQVAKLLRDIFYPGVVSMGLAFRQNQIRHPLDGFGALIPTREGKSTLGVLFSSTLFPERAPSDSVLLTAFIGGARNPQVHTHDDDWLLNRVVEDLRPLLGITGLPDKHWINRWPQAIPQYELGHLQRIETIDAQLQECPGVSLLGNWRGGIAVGDCINSAEILAEQLKQQVQ